MSDTLILAKDLISLASVTPEDAGCQQLIAGRLEKLGFKATHLRFDDVDNLWITHGEGAPCFIFVGHTDAQGKCTVSVPANEAPRLGFKITKPGHIPLRTYKVAVKDGQLLVDLDKEAGE